MKLPVALTQAETEMNRAKKALLDYSESAEQRDPARHRALLEDVQRTTSLYLDQIRAMIRDAGMTR
jgi:hypothetical protein